MTSAEELAYRLSAVAKRMREESVPPYETRPVALSLGELDLIVRSLVVIGALRSAIERK